MAKRQAFSRSLPRWYRTRPSRGGTPPRAASRVDRLADQLPNEARSPSFATALSRGTTLRQEACGATTGESWWASRTRRGLSRRADRAEYGRRIHPTAESDDQRPGWKICFGTVASLIDA